MNIKLSRLSVIVFALAFLLTPFFGSKAIAIGKPDFVSSDYIVVFKDDVKSPYSAANEMALLHGLSLDFVYSSALKGFSATIPTARLEKLSRDSRVQFISQDRSVSTTAQTIPTGIGRIGTSSSGNTGSGVGVAVIDTGIDLTHPDLQANIVANYSCVKGKKNGSDDNGHGTHVAGTIAAINNGIGVVGVAPQAKLLAVKVLNSAGSGTWSSIICGIDWVTANAARYNIKVANMSLGGGGTSDNNCGNSNNDALHRAICRSTASGITYVVSAGNDGSNANVSVPAAYDDSVITVSALADSDGILGGLGLPTSYGPDDTFATFSNFGSVVDLAAPGVSIYSTWRNGGYKSISGTSMAAPHVSGAAAMYVSANPGSNWIQVKNGLISIGEALGSGHADPSGLHSEPVLRINGL